MEKKPNAPSESDLFVFDICDTLFYSNTTFDFIKFVLRQKSWRAKQIQFNLYTSKVSPVFLGLYVLQKFTKVDWAKKQCLQLLKGISKQELYHLGKAFEQRFLSSRTIEQTHELLWRLKKEGKRIILISASIDPVVSAIAEALEVGFYSSELGYDTQGNCTGSLTKEMTGQKLEVLHTLLTPENARFMVATDNFSDRKLVEAAQQRFVVIYSEQARKFWQDLKPDFIQLFSK